MGGVSSAFSSSSSSAAAAAAAASSTSSSSAAASSSSSSASSSSSSSASSSGKRKAEFMGGFMDLVFSWSLEDILNPDLYKNQVEKIPKSFQSVEEYFDSYVFPLLEETRSVLASSMDVVCGAPFAEVNFLHEAKPYGTLLYDVKVDDWRNRFNDRGKDPYRTLPGDIFLILDVEPSTVSEQRLGNTWALACVTSIRGDEDEHVSTCVEFKLKASKDIGVEDGLRQSMFVVFLTNITTNRRIWNTLSMSRNLKIVKQVLCTDSVVEVGCDLCRGQNKQQLAKRFDESLSNLNDSQIGAILDSVLLTKCGHKSSVELIWGPPGTGKTKIVGVMLFILLKMGCRTVICTPTNVAIREVASRLLKQLSSSFDGEHEENVKSLGDILLFGNKDRLKVGSDVEEIFLDYRVKRLIECLGPETGWKNCITSMATFLEDCVCQYHIFVENELIKEKTISQPKFKSFLEFVRAQFKSNALPLRHCFYIFCSHIPRSFIQESNFRDIMLLISLLDSFETLLFNKNVVSEALEELFSHQEKVEECIESSVETLPQLCITRNKCLLLLKTLQFSLEKLFLPSVLETDSIEKFCFQVASMYFCTSSSSYKLHSVNMEPLDLVVIDEAAQLKECESAIPLQLPYVRHAVLVGDECQLPAMVNSTVSNAAGFGRSLFERLSSLGHSKRLLNIQYRMHPKISSFPNSKFYENQILDATNVKREGYARLYLPGPMFGPYSFINVVGGKEELDGDGHSRRNLVEVAIVMKIIQKLYRVSGSQNQLRVGVISPYAAQVVAIQDKLIERYQNPHGFFVKVKTVDGFQGGEEDIIIISTVRSNTSGSIGFLESHPRTNVALTRARHSLWILGNERTLTCGGSIWGALVRDAKDRQCFFNADEDNDMGKAILDVKKEFDQLDDFLKGDSILFKSARWKVLFSDNFKKSFRKLVSSRMKRSVISLLLKLSSGWRPRKRNVDSVCETSLQILKQFKVEGLYVVCSIDIIKESNIEESKYVQVLKIWDILRLEEVPKLVKRLDSIFSMYTDDFIGHCKEKCLEGDLEVPKDWVTSYEIIRYKNVENSENSSAGTIEGRTYVENSKVSESLLLMKFYSLSSGVVNHLLSDRNGVELNLPFEVTEEEMNIILFNRSTFILGRSGTGKTTVLTMKLFQKEQHHRIALDGCYAGESSNSSNACQRNEDVEFSGEAKGTVLRQLFVTVSPKLCYAIKQHVSQLKSFACGENFASESSSADVDDVDDTLHFKDIPDSFIGIASKKYPLVVTFHKFLMMLDGTLGNSYFDRFHLQRKQVFDGKDRKVKSIALQTFIRTKEVNFDRFSSLYWPRFNTLLTKKLDPSRVFTEITSHIKGGLQPGELNGGKLSKEGYVLMSHNRVSTLSMRKREIIYDIFQDYEKMKMERGEFDLADVVIDLHCRLRNSSLECDKMDFVYIDEVQDLTMRQVSLFKYICNNVDDGFVFSGDTAQTIARGIDFRFQDIRSLFYNEFLLPSKSEGSSGKKEKGYMGEIFKLSQNFRTHAGVLKLAQSVIDLLYHFFPDSIDVLKPETSLICGEAPVLLESGNDENAIVTILGNRGNACGNIVGFGAEQVILVRDECARTEISGYVGKQALVLTIVECKGLEFQDVLLYNFFGSSPLRNQWRVVYGYMKELDMLDPTSAKSTPGFDEARHNILCSELKQLYVAVTRTRQRLWIYENIEEFSRPMFNYWQKLCLVQIRKLDDSLAQAMQVASSSEEWKARGIKLFQENNYEMATMCFERAGDTVWEKRAKAAGLKATADRVRDSNPEMSRSILREAAQIFDSIGKAQSAAECFCDLDEYEKAGRIYLDKCGESGLEKAGECFTLAGCYELAAEVYAKGNYFSECLSVCTKGKIFDMGLQYIQYWKKHCTKDDGLVGKNTDLDRIEEQFLENCAKHYFNIKDKKSMMNFVKAFCSMDSRRNFLKSLDCYEELLWLEEESGNFVEAAEIAKLRGDLLLEANLLANAGHFNKSSFLILRFVLSKSLWASGSCGWPMKPFAKKEELLLKAIFFARKQSDVFYDSICLEVKVLLNEETNLFELNQSFNASRNHKSLGSEILLVRKILDTHLCIDVGKYVWEESLPVDLKVHSDKMISKNDVSVQTLVFFWNSWKEKVVNIFKYLAGLETDGFSKTIIGYGEFCANYFGVRKIYNNLKTVFLLLINGADWTKKIDDRFFRRNGKLVSVDSHHFAQAARSHWHSELLSVGIEVLKTLESLYNLSSKNLHSDFRQSVPLIHMHEIANFLRKHEDNRMLQNYLQKSSEIYCAKICPLRLAENMISLRRTELSRHLLEHMIENITLKGELTYGKIGRAVMMWLSSGKPTDDHYKKIATIFEQNPSWKAFVKSLIGNLESKSFVFTFGEALKDVFNANWRAHDYMSPTCFLYLLERFQILLSASSSSGVLFAVKSSFVECLIFQNLDRKQSGDVETQSHFQFLAEVVRHFLYGERETKEWILQSGLKPIDYYPMFVLRLVVVLCLVCLNSREHFNIVFELIRTSPTTSYLPRNFYGALRKFSHVNAADVLAEALRMIGDPMVIVSLGKDCQKFEYPGAIFVDMQVSKSREDIIGVLFPEKTNAPDLEVVRSVESGFSTGISEENKTKNPRMNWGLFWEISDALKDDRRDGDLMRFVLNSSKIKVEVENNIKLLTTAMAEFSKTEHCVDKDGEAANMIEELERLSSALDMRDQSFEKNISCIGELVKKLKSRWEKVETLLKSTVKNNEESIQDNKEAEDADEAKKTIATVSSKTQNKGNDDADAEASNKAKGNNNNNKSRKNKKSSRRRA